MIIVQVVTMMTVTMNMMMTMMWWMTKVIVMMTMTARVATLRILKMIFLPTNKENFPERATHHFFGLQVMEMTELRVVQHYQNIPL